MTLAFLSVDTGDHFTQNQVSQSLTMNRVQEVTQLHHHVLLMNIMMDVK